MQTHTSAWTRKARLNTALRRIRIVVDGRGSSVHKDPLLINALDSIERGEETAGRNAVGLFMDVCADLSPEHRGILDQAKSDLTPPWNSLQAFAPLLKLVAVIVSAFKLVIGMGPTHFVLRRPIPSCTT